MGLAAIMLGVYAVLISTALVLYRVGWGLEQARANGVGIALVGLGILVLALAVGGVFAPVWWFHALSSLGAFFVGMTVTILMMELTARGTLDKLGPGGMVFLLPILGFIGLIPLSGVVRWVIVFFTSR